MTIREAKIYIREELSDFYPENEISSFTRILFSDLFGISSVQLISRENDDLADSEFTRLKGVLNRLKNYEPLQYIVGFTEFYGLKFHVSPAVLIPRPETEELVDLIVEENKSSTASTSSATEDSTGSANGTLTNLISEKGLKILDIGTGSGCIAISLAKNLSNAQVFALDVSSEALEIAKRNAFDNNVELTFIQGNILYKSNSKDVLAKRPTGIALEKRLTSFNIIVSNPPYVTVSEKQQMEKNVLDYEPDTALFVENDNPLIFYKAIAQFAKQHLSANGKLYFEINEQFGSDVKEILTSFGFSGIEIVKDINERDRFVRGTNAGFDKLNLQ